MSNIKNFAVQPTNWLHLLDADDEPMYATGPDGNPDETKPMRIELYGPGSKQYAKAQAENNNKMVDKLKKKGKADQTAAQKAEELAEFLSDCTKSMENIEYDELQGEFLYKAVYRDVSIGFVAEQVNKFLGDWGNFSKGSVTK